MTVQDQEHRPGRVGKQPAAKSRNTTAFRLPSSAANHSAPLALTAEISLTAKRSPVAATTGVLPTLSNSLRSRRLGPMPSS
jgi:hypothetical protein